MKRAFDPVLFVEVAERLVQDANSQAGLRTAIGRAYYAMFLIAREKTGIRDKQGAHDKVLEALEHRKEHEVASELGKLRRLHEVADYQLLPGVAERDWKTNWERAQRIVSAIRPRLEAMTVIYTLRRKRTTKG